MLTLQSTDFAHGSSIPRLHTCEGKDVSPALQFGGVPQGAKSLALVAHDPDAPDPAAPKMDYVHWVLYNIPPGCKGIEQGGEAPAGSLPGLNDWKKSGYGGPCPPIGRHRYFFVLYALDTILDDLGLPTRQRLERAMAGHLLGKAELMGTYVKG
jgi:Raf kinase inhibitor-like YbhB/YbcL family protein